MCSQLSPPNSSIFYYNHRDNNLILPVGMSTSRSRPVPRIAVRTSLTALETGKAFCILPFMLVALGHIFVTSSSISSFVTSWLVASHFLVRKIMKNRKIILKLPKLETTASSITSSTTMYSNVMQYVLDRPDLPRSSTCNEKWRKSSGC